jgi:hypothetical protein
MALRGYPLPVDALDAFLADLDPQDRRLLGELVAEEAEAHGAPDPADVLAAPVVARLLRELAGRLAVELEAERDPPPDDGWEDDPGWDAPAIPYGEAELGPLSDAVVHATPALDAALGRFLEAMPGRRRRGLMRRARRAWQAAGVRDPDDPAGRDHVRAALVAEALQEGFEPPPRTVDVPAAVADLADDAPERLLARVPEADDETAHAIATANATLGPDAVRETLDQAAFLALRGALGRHVHGRWVTAALQARADALR